MEKRHFFGARQQREALKEIFGPPRTSGPGRRPRDYLAIFRSLLLGVMNDVNTDLKLSHYAD